MPKVVARFEKVSREQFIKDALVLIKDSEMPLFSEKELNAMYDTIQLPRRKTKGAAGHDFISPFSIYLKPDETVTIPTGIRCCIDEDYVLDLFPRSGQGFKFRLRLNNTVAIIDEDFYYGKDEGHIRVKLSNEGNLNFTCEKDTAFCQGIFHEYFIAEGNENPEATRDGGIGSTGM